ncbi:hypothetical protein [Acinetobacter soli]|uniref:hypothetical protein n=1 Tax=Acinetobacter soli TaxID=487316 RepID=UPI0020779733|nr:hypothetical protein [Acinetobacter soli]
MKIISLKNPLQIGLCNKAAAIYTYGDTIEDHEMLSLATHAFYRWQPVHPNSL